MLEVSDMPPENDACRRGKYKPLPADRYRFGKYHCRCNRRGCQARVVLRRHPDQYARPPRCKSCGNASLYVDWYRTRRGPYDSAPVCRDPNCPYLETRLTKMGRGHPYHRVNTRGCSGYEEWILERAAIGSRHSPSLRAAGREEECPF